MQIGLNLSKEYWKEIPEPLVQGEWESIRFHENSITRISQFPPVRAIYLLIIDLRSFSSSEPFSTIKNVLYVGSSTDLRKRFRDHIRGGKTDNLRYKVREHLDKNLNFWYKDVGKISQEQIFFYEESLMRLFGKNLNSMRAMSEENFVKNMEALKGQITG